MLLLSRFKQVLSFATVLSVALWQSPAVHAAMYQIEPGSDIVGEVAHVRSSANDTLLTIANQYGVGMHEILESNPQLHQDQDQASQYLGRGKKVIVPTQFILPPYRKGIVINLPELRLYYFTPDGRYVYTYPVGLGRMEWRTPLANTSVIGKETDPVWTVPPSIHAYVLEETGRNLPKRVMPGPDNPLGPYALRLGKSGYLIHGTNQPWSIGKYISSGCIRLHNEDITELYHMVPVGTPVHLINYPDKAGWARGELYLQSRLPMDVNIGSSPIHTVVSKAAAKRDGVVDWGKVAAVESQRHGIPQPIGKGNATGPGPGRVADLDKSRGIRYNNPNYVAQLNDSGGYNPAGYVPQKVEMIALYEDTEDYFTDGNRKEPIQYIRVNRIVPREIELN